jgi:hypothetical protein
MQGGGDESVPGKKLVRREKEKEHDDCAPEPDGDEPEEELDKLEMGW